MKRRDVVMGAAASGLLLASRDALAFRPRGPWLVEQAMAKRRRRNINTLDVQQEVTLFGLPNAPRGLNVPGKVLVSVPASMRVERTLPEGTYLEIDDLKRSKLVEPGKGAVVKKRRPDILRDFLTAGEELSRADASARWEKAFTDAKIDLDRVTFTRFDGRVAYLIGCKPWELGTKPAAVLDKDTLLLQRVITVTKTADGQRTDDLRLLGWGSAEGGNWFPKTVERWRDEVLVERGVTRAVERNQAIDKLLFDTSK